MDQQWVSALLEHFLCDLFTLDTIHHKTFISLFDVSVPIQLIIY